MHLWNSPLRSELA